MKFYSLLFSILFAINFTIAQDFQKDSIQLKSIYNQVLNEGNVYENLRSLCKDVGHRLSGSPGAAKAVNWGERLLSKYDLDSVWLQELMVPHWVRGDVERLDFISGNKIYKTSSN